MPDNIVSAQQHTTGVSITPLRQEGEIAPGFVYSGTLLIKNSGMNAQQINLSVESFNVTNQSYDYLFKSDTSESSWVTFSQDSLNLTAGKEATVIYQVNVPIGTEPAGYYLALFATNHPTAVTRDITPSERVASLLYLTVTGDASRSGQLLSLASPVVTFGDATWSTTLQNTGSLHYRSTYSASVQSIFGHQFSFSEDSRLILPQSVRLIEGELKAPPVLGLYKVVYSVSLGDNPGLEETRWFLYLPPLQLLLIALIVIGLLILKGRRRAA